MSNGGPAPEGVDGLMDNVNALIAKAREEGYAKGREDGYKAGYDEGHERGLQIGRVSGLKEAAEQVQALATTASAQAAEANQVSDNAAAPQHNSSGTQWPMDTPVEELDLTVRSYNCLKREGLHIVGAVLQTPLEELRLIRNFGEKSRVEIGLQMARAGYLYGWPPPLSELKLQPDTEQLVAAAGLDDVHKVLRAAFHGGLEAAGFDNRIISDIRVALHLYVKGRAFGMSTYV